MLAGITIMVISVGIGIPLIAVIGMGVMRLVKARLINGLGKALHTHKEQSRYRQFQYRITHQA